MRHDHDLRIVDVMDRLTPRRYTAGIRELVDRDVRFAEIVSRFGRPALWARPSGFRTLIHIVIEQKISIDSARAVMARIERLLASSGGTRPPADSSVGFTPDALLARPQCELVACGLSRGKAEYCHDIARAVASGRLDLEALETLPNEVVLKRLVAVRGIGPWTAGVYLMLALCRVDGWASGDRALAVSLAECDGLERVPSYSELDALAERWRPQRGVAARLLWHAYLERRGRSVPV